MHKEHSLAAALLDAEANRTPRLPLSVIGELFARVADLRQSVPYATVSLLARLASDKRTSVRASAAHALPWFADLYPDRVEQLLLPLAKDEAIDVRTAAFEALTDLIESSAASWTLIARWERLRSRARAILFEDPADQAELRPEAPPSSLADAPPTIRNLFEAGDLDAALRAAEQLVVDEGDLDSPTLRPHRAWLERLYESVIGPLACIPQPGRKTARLDPRSAFLLSRLDGNTTVADLLELSAMRPIEAKRCLALLIQRGVVVALENSRA